MITPAFADFNADSSYNYPVLEFSDNESTHSELELGFFDFAEEKLFKEEPALLKQKASPGLLQTDTSNKSEQSSYTKAESESSFKLGVRKPIAKRKNTSLSYYSSESNYSSMENGLETHYRRVKAVKKLKMVKMAKKINQRKSTFPLQCEVVYERLEERDEFIAEDGDDQLLDCESFSETSSYCGDEAQESRIPQRAPKFDFGVLMSQMNRSREVNSYGANACFSTFKVISRLSSNIAKIPFE